MRFWARHGQQQITAQKTKLRTQPFKKQTLVICVEF
jgi:hypothetical protein